MISLKNNIFYLWSIMDLFENYDINGSEDSGSKIIFKLSPKEPMGNICPHCGSKKYQAHTSRTVKFKDLPKHGKTTELHITYKRKRCADCKKTTPQPMPSMSSTYQLSSRLESFLKSKMFHAKFTDLAAETGVDEGTIRYVFNNYCTDLYNEYNFFFPETVLLYEVNIVRKPRLMLVNPNRCTIIDLLAYPIEKEIDAVSLAHPQTKYVCLTTHNKELFLGLLCDAFSSALKTTDLGYKAKITARNLFMKERLSDEEVKAFSSFSWSRKNPILYSINLTKDKMVEAVFLSSSSNEASDRFFEIVDSLPEDQRIHFEKSIAHIRGYGKYAFSWIDIPSAKSIHTCIPYKDAIANALAKMPRVFGLESVRAKLLFNSTHDIEDEKNYGVSMKSLPDFLLQE